MTMMRTGATSPGSRTLSRPAPPPRIMSALLILTSSIVGSAVYSGFELFFSAIGVRKGSHELAVFLGFFVAPLGALLLWGRRPELGRLDRGFWAGAAAYQLFLPPIILVIPSNRAYFEAYRMGAGEAGLWALLTLLQVSSVDFFTRRVVQLEVERAWGPGQGLLAGFIAWCAGHVLEYGWLRGLMGPPGTLLYIGLAGVLTGIVYWRTKNALGLMAGHFILNLLAAVAAVALLGSG